MPLRCATPRRLARLARLRGPRGLLRLVDPPERVAGELLAAAAVGVASGARTAQPRMPRGPAELPPDRRHVPHRIDQQVALDRLDALVALVALVGIERRGDGRRGVEDRGVVDAAVVADRARQEQLLQVVAEVREGLQLERQALEVAAERALAVGLEVVDLG